DLKKGFIAAAAVSEAPDEMSALGLVPARCNIIGAANFADLRGNPVAKKAFLEETPRSILWLGDRLKNATGLTLDDLDQVALGVEMTDKLPKIFVIVQTRAAYDSQAVLKSFSTAKGLTKLSLRNRPLVRFPLPRLGD